MDTVELNGEGFDVKVEQGAKVKAGPDSGSGRFRGSKGKGQISGDSGDLPKRSRIYYEQKDGIVAKAEGEYSEIFIRNPKQGRDVKTVRSALFFCLDLYKQVSCQKD